MLTAVALAGAYGGCGVQGGRGAPADAGPQPAARADEARDTRTPSRPTPARAAPGASSRTPNDDPARLARAVDLVRRARAYERRGSEAATAPAGVAAGAPAAITSFDAHTDSARQAYVAAAALAPEVADWLRLRAAALDPDAAARAQVFAALTTPAARARTPLSEAAARLRAGDPAGAAASYEAVGRPAAALGARLRLTPPGTPGRDAVRAALLRLAAAAPPVDSTGVDERPVEERPAERARTAALLLDSAFAPLPPDDRLVVARALGTATARDQATLARAAAAYAGALAGGAGSARDWYAYGDVLARLRRWRDAAAAHGRVLESAADPPLAASAGYARGRALLRFGDGGSARAALAGVAARFPADSAAAAARFTLAELDAGGGRAADARRAYLRVAADHGATRWAPTAAVRAGVLALAAGDARAAAAAFDLVAARWPGAPDAPAAGYWAGRAHAAAGDAGLARLRWQRVVETAPESYYGWLAARRLGRAAWVPPTTRPVPADSEAAAAARRAALCEQLGLMPEASYERGWLVAWADTSTRRMLTAAAALVETARPGPGIRLAERAVARGAERSAAVWRLLYPLRYAEPLAREARAAGVDPALAAALVKQESNFTADAVSPAGARGLMQVMPSVGRAIWRGPGAWDAALLFRPEVNIALGMRHLDAALAGWPHPAYALAAYNAGGGRVRRWRQLAGAGDPELFVERIPFEETRDYVRIVLRNREFYRALYGL